MQLSCLIFLLTTKGRHCSYGKRKINKVDFNQIGSSYHQNFVCADNSGQNVWDKVKLSSKIIHD